MITPEARPGQSPRKPDTKPVPIARVLQNVLLTLTAGGAAYLGVDALTHGSITHKILGALRANLPSLVVPPPEVTPTINSETQTPTIPAITHVSPEAAAIPTPNSEQVATITPTVTPEAPVLSVEITELQERVGENFKIVKERDYYRFAGDAQLKIYENGTAVLERKGVSRIILIKNILGESEFEIWAGDWKLTKNPQTNELSDWSPKPVEVPTQVYSLNEKGEHVPLLNFESIEEARVFLEGEGGAKWLSGNPAKEIELFPWNSVETWRMFSDLRPTGNQPHFVFLVPHTDNKKFSVIGVENIGGNIILDYIDYDGNPRAISYKGPLHLKDLLGADFEKLFENNIVVWSDISYPNANSNGRLCTNRFRNPIPGITDGFACSIDGKRGHYFQSQNIVPEHFK